MTSSRGSTVSAMAWMVGLSAALFWLPVFGGLIAGYVGGRKAGSVGAAIIAALLPGFLFAVIVALMGGLLGWIPIIGQLWAVVAGFGGLVLSTMSVVPLLIGAVLGGRSS